MNTARRALIIVAIGGLSILGTGCESGEKAGEYADDEHPQSEHPEGEHPEGEHPEGEHPDGEHPDG